MSRKEQFAENEFYHLYNRGTDRRAIFLDDRDFERFTRLLYVCNSGTPVIMKDLQAYNFSKLVSEYEPRKPLVAIGVYCLMPNHFHLLVRQLTPQGISIFMKKLATGYSMFFNQRYERSGRLFESTFKSSRITNDNYLQYLFAYIHLNPIKLVDPEWKSEGIKDLSRVAEHLKQYAYSSYSEYLGVDRPEKAVITRDSEIFPDYFESSFEFNNFIDFWLTYKDAENKEEIIMPKTSPVSVSTQAILTSTAQETVPVV
ncbi:transposase [Candidatus Roizmanbacteria bacterium]|nr:transposase [Candidatus Roizmanbacteria bacterium]